MILNGTPPGKQSGTHMTDCTVPRHDTQDEPTPTIHNGHLCQTCARQLRTDLTRLPTLYTQLEDALPTRNTGASLAAINGLTGPAAIPFNDAVSECRSQIEHDLHYWASETATDRRTTLPPVLPPAAVPFHAGWITAATKWIPYRTWAPHITGAINHDTTRAWHLLQPRRVKTMNWIDPCPHCRTLRELQATIYETDGDPRPSVIECLTCRQTWTSGIAWLELARQVHTLTKTTTA